MLWVIKLISGPQLTHASDARGGTEDGTSDDGATAYGT